MELREIQKPLKERYREDPGASQITLRAEGAEGEDAMNCSVDIGRAVQAAQAHAGVGGAGTVACSGDLLLAALAACAQLTCQMVAANMGIAARRIEAKVEGDLDLRGTLGVDKTVPAGFGAIRLRFEIDAPGVGEAELESLISKTERYCTVLQTLRDAPPVDVQVAASGGHR
jgi:uncharacterized OsmC-like protein